MGIYARQDVSFAAHQPAAPMFLSSGERLQFDDFSVFAVDDHGNAVGRAIAQFDAGSVAQAWELARSRFLQTFNELRVPCKLIGRIFN